MRFRERRGHLLRPACLMAKAVSKTERSHDGDDDEKANGCNQGHEDDDEREDRQRNEGSEKSVTSESASLTELDEFRAALPHRTFRGKL